jgi:hypothetical protein
MVRLAALAGATLMVMASMAQAASAQPVQAGEVEGWTLMRQGGELVTCEISGPTDGQATLVLVAEGPQYLLEVIAPDFPQAMASYPVTLSFDGGPPIPTIGLTRAGVVGINVGRGASARQLASASSVGVTVNGHGHSFSLRNVRLALDAVARCAGVPTLSEQVDQPPAAIPGGGAWRLLVTLPGLTERICSARVAGPQIDTILLLNKTGDLVLMGGRQDWATWAAAVPIDLSIDGADPVHLDGDTVSNLITVLIKDPELVRRLREARVLDWTLPTGHVRGDVAGLGAALDAMKACKAAA